MTAHVLCECEQRDCSSSLPLTTEEYAAVVAPYGHDDSITYVVLPFHQSPDDDVVADRGDYLVVQNANIREG